MQWEDRKKYFREKKKALSDRIGRGGPARIPKAAEALAIPDGQRIQKIPLILSRRLRPASRNIFERRAGKPLGLEVGKSAVHAAVLKEVRNRIEHFDGH
jgi:hypothetical protein